MVYQIKSLSGSEKKLRLYDRKASVMTKNINFLMLWNIVMKLNNFLVNWFKIRTLSMLFYGHNIKIIVFILKIKWLRLCYGVFTRDKMISIIHCKQNFMVRGKRSQLVSGKMVPWEKNRWKNGRLEKRSSEKWSPEKWHPENKFPFGFVRMLGLSVFFGFGLLFLQSKRSDRNQLGNFWVYSNSGFVPIFWIWFIVFAEWAKRSEPTRKLLSLFEFWIYSSFLDLVCCFCGVGEASGAHSETFEFVRILDLFVFGGFSLHFSGDHFPEDCFSGNFFIGDLFSEDFFPGGHFAETIFPGAIFPGIFFPGFALSRSSKAG